VKFYINNELKSIRNKKRKGSEDAIHAEVLILVLFEKETRDQDVRVDLEREIARAESHRLLEECDAQENPDRFPDALRCLNGLLKSNPDTPIAEEAGRRIESLHVPFWNMVQAAATREMYEQYLEFFPGGIFAPLARDRIEQMQ